MTAMDELHPAPHPSRPDPKDPPDPGDRPEVLDRREGPYGEAVLRRHGDRLEIIANGTFLMDTSDGRSERLLVDAALASLPAGRQGASLLVGGLGVGFSLARALAAPRWGGVTVVERESAVVDWHRAGHFVPHVGDVLADPRVRLVRTDLREFLHGGAELFDALCLDIDNGPDWTVTEDNGSLYNPSGLLDCRERLTAGGVLAVWSARPSANFEAALRGAGFAGVRTLAVPVSRGVPDVVHIAVKA